MPTDEPIASAFSVSVRASSLPVLSMTRNNLSSTMNELTRRSSVESSPGVSAFPEKEATLTTGTFAACARTVPEEASRIIMMPRMMLRFMVCPLIDVSEKLLEKADYRPPDSAEKPRIPKSFETKQSLVHFVAA